MDNGYFRNELEDIVLLENSFLQGVVLNDFDVVRNGVKNAEGTTLDNCVLRLGDFNLVSLKYFMASGCNFYGCDFSTSKIDQAWFIDCKFSHCCFSDCSFDPQRFRNCMFKGCQFANATNESEDQGYGGMFFNDTTHALALQCPEEGSFVGWKKCRDDMIVKLLIPEDAKRSSGTTRKCRCDKAKVLEVFDKGGHKKKRAVSRYDRNFEYCVGKMVYADRYDTNRWNECASGIHFFITCEEAEMYTL